MTNIQDQTEESVLGVTPGKASPLKYYALVACGLPKVRAKVIAGYSKSTSSYQIEASQQAHGALKTVERHRADLQAIPGLTLSDQAIRLLKVAEHKKTNNADKIKATREIVNVLGYESPKRIETQVKGLFLEFKDLGSADLAALMDEMGV